MKTADLVDTHPRVFHMAEYDAWPSIKRHGLLSTEALLDLFEVSEPRRSRLLQERRPDSVALSHPIHGQAMVRDNGPLHEGKLENCLTDMTVPEFLGLLNSHVFFWPSAERLDRLFNASAYAHRRHLVVEVDTASLVAAHEDAIRVSHINSGSTVFKAQPRGSSTLARISDFDFDHWRQKRTRRTAIAEVCVRYSVPNVTAHAVQAYVREPSGGRQIVWRRT